MSRKEEGRGLTNIENGVNAPIQWLEDYIKKSKERLIMTARNSTDTIMIDRTTTKKQKWEEKPLYGYFNWETSEISHEKPWTWLR